MEDIRLRCLTVALALSLLIPSLAGAGAAVEAFDITAQGQAECGPLELRAWPIQSDQPGISLDPNGPFGVTISYHDFQCTEEGPFAIFHVEPSTDIVGLCLSQSECSDVCAALFGEVP